MNDIRAEARASWNLKGGMKMAPMGKGYILFQFESEGDMATMWRRSLTRVGNQVIRFQPWKPDFDVHAKNIETKLVWIRFPNLPLKYWHEKILLTMAKAAGRPVALDRCTRTAAMGTFARVQVEIEIGVNRLEEIHVERKQPGTNEIFWFTQTIIYQDGMPRCGFCKKMGHLVNVCRAKKDVDAREEALRKENIPGAVFADEYAGAQSNGLQDGRQPVTEGNRSGRLSSQSNERYPTFSGMLISRNLEGNPTNENLNGNIQICLPLEEAWSKEQNLSEGHDFVHYIEGDNHLTAFGSNSDDGLDAGSVNGSGDGSRAHMIYLSSALPREDDGLVAAPTHAESDHRANVRFNQEAHFSSIMDNGREG
ncbi:uncharacterized protein LOC122062570 [Macadamia integrifolia]|uniref:uncharacterized protein LOC122062570 n=1 Tax=Macadamia integrifolia TaxID=60698 RepID=UPI001C4E57AA|nr:uncharacterized protein LOC122062570 [Macadamia integrifolia]